jgi:hypothetical protein
MRSLGLLDKQLQRRAVADAAGARVAAADRRWGCGRAGGIDAVMRAFARGVRQEGLVV